jgi:hypothetical protein
MKPYKPRPPGSAHDALARMMEEIGVADGRPGQGMKVAADFEDRSVNTLYHELDPAAPSQLSYARVARLVDRFKVQAPAHHLAGLAGGIFVPTPEASGRNEAWAELSAETAEEVGMLTAESIRAVGAGLTPAQAKDLLPDLYDIVRHVSGLIGLAQAAANPGGNRDDA